MDKLPTQLKFPQTPEEQADAFYERLKTSIPNPWLFVNFMNQANRFEHAKAIILHPKWKDGRELIIKHLNEEDAARLHRIENMVFGEM